MRGPVEKIERTIRSILGQSYPFVELFLIHCEDDLRHAALAQEFRGVRSPVPVRIVPVPYPVNASDDRIRALEQTQPKAKGRWYVIVDSEIVLDRIAVESAIEFAGTGEISALALR